MQPNKLPNNLSKKYTLPATRSTLIAFMCLSGFALMLTPAYAQRGHDEGGRGERGDAHAEMRGADHREGGEERGRTDGDGAAERPFRLDAGGHDGHAFVEPRGFAAAPHIVGTHFADPHIVGTHFADPRIRHDVFVPAHYPTHFVYPHYVTSYASVGVYFSPFSFYYGVYGVLPSYIDSTFVVVAPPSRVFVEVPVYVNGAYVVSSSGASDYYLYQNREDNQWRSDPDLKRTVSDVEYAFQKSDSGLLAPHINAAAKVAIFSKGHYDYSLDGGAYLDMTRDFLQSAHTTSFDVYAVHNKTSGVYQAFAKHVYQGQDGQTRTVYVCMVLERTASQWMITQIDTSPDQINP